MNEYANYIEIDDADVERSHLWVSIMDADGGLIELIEQYPTAERGRAIAMARRLSRVLNLPLKLKQDRKQPPHLFK
jgi:hypothetical protein